MTRDHIPPRSLFSKPRPSNMITVPCCVNCNSNFQEDDEYFRTALLLRRDVKAPEIYDKVIRSLQMPQKQGFRKNIEKSLVLVEVKSPGGIFIGTEYAYKPKFNRLYKTVERIVRGLYFHEMGHALPKDDILFAVQPTDSLRAKNKLLIEIINYILPKIAQKPTNAIGNVFRYKYGGLVGSLQETPFGYVWLLDFYERIPFICLTASKEFFLHDYRVGP